jgi:hypothetical protein
MGQKSTAPEDVRDAIEPQRRQHEEHASGVFLAGGRRGGAKVGHRESQTRLRLALLLDDLGLAVRRERHARDVEGSGELPAGNTSGSGAASSWWRTSTQGTGTRWISRCRTSWSPA